MGYKRVTAPSAKSARRKCSSKRLAVGKVNKIKGTKRTYGVYTHKRK